MQPQNMLQLFCKKKKICRVGMMHYAMFTKRQEKLVLKILVGAAALGIPNCQTLDYVVHVTVKYI